MRVVMDRPFWLEYGQFFVGGYEDSQDCFAGQQNGLCGAAVPGRLFLRTGLHTGKVGLRVEVHERMPSVEYDAEDVVEASYIPSGDVLLSALSDNGVPLELETIAYRVRYSAWGMDAGHQSGPPADDESLVDRYLLQFWPAGPAPERVVKVTSRQAAYCHRVARDLPTPEQLAEQRAERARLAEEQRLAEWAAAWGGALPTPRIQNTMHGRELSALDRSFVDGLEQTDPETLRAMARWAARRACEEAGYAGLERIAGILDRLDRGADWLETLNGPPQPIDPEAEPQPVIHQFVARRHGWFADREPYDNTATVVTAAFNEDSFKAAVNTIWLATEPFIDRTQLIGELRQRFFRNPAPSEPRR